MSPTARFHAHLDGCARCACDPFNLCNAGAALLLATVLDGPPSAEAAPPWAVRPDGDYEATAGDGLILAKPGNVVLLPCPPDGAQGPFARPLWIVHGGSPASKPVRVGGALAPGVGGDLAPRALLCLSPGPDLRWTHHEEATYLWHLQARQRVEPIAAADATPTPPRWAARSSDAQAALLSQARELGVHAAYQVSDALLAAPGATALGEALCPYAKDASEGPQRAEWLRGWVTMTDSLLRLALKHESDRYAVLNATLRLPPTATP